MVQSVFLSYFKEGHSNYFNFFPAVGQDDMQMISKDYETFWDIYLDEKEDDKSFVFENDYLDTAVNHGFFNEDKFLEIVGNVQAVFNPIKVHFPEFFIAPKRGK